ncbi:MAG TPA: flagellar basal body protein FliL [Rhodospirillaceae bacterium]|nr:flagellar basal body protein FliL [Rhodospirillaceae bacterium]
MADKKKEKEEEKDEKDAGGEGGGEGAAEGEGAEGEGGGFDLKKIILFVVVPLLLLIGGGGAGLYFTGMLDGLLGKTAEVPLLDEHGEPVLDEHGNPVMAPKEEAKDDGHGEKKGGHGEKKGGGGHGEEGGDSAFLAIPTMIVNLNTQDGNPRYLRLTVQLELEDPADKAAVEAIIPRVIDQFQTYLRELRVKDLRGSAGIYRLQMELLWRVNQAAAPSKIKDVLFQEILIQ